MNKRIFGLALSTFLFGFCFPAEAQQAGKVPRIGYLHFRAGPDAADEPSGKHCVISALRF